MSFSERKVSLCRLKGLGPNPDMVSKPIACGLVRFNAPDGRALLKPFSGNAAQGYLTWQQDESNRPEFVARIKDVEPGRDSLVIHRYGDYSASDTIGFGVPYMPETNTVKTTPHYSWPLKEGVLAEITVGESRRAIYTHVFEHPMTGGSVANVGDRSSLRKRPGRLWRRVAVALGFPASSQTSSSELSSAGSKRIR